MAKFRSPLFPTGFLDPKSRGEARASLRLPWRLRRTLSAVLQTTASAGCTSWELERLHRSLLVERPTLAVELGSGVSTVVLAYAARALAEQGQPCRLVSVEQSAQYQSDMLRWFPDDLRPHVEFILSPVVGEPFVGGFIGHRYLDLPDEPFDWVFVDGPQLPRSTRKHPELFDSDVLRIARHGHPMLVHVDGRRSTVSRLLEQLNPASVERDAIHNWTTIRLGQTSL